jgi:hypothetical protein
MAEPGQSHIWEEPVMDNGITWVGMDVHKESIVITAVRHDSDKATARFEIPNTDTGVHRLVKRLREMGGSRQLQPTVMRQNTSSIVFLNMSFLAATPTFCELAFVLLSATATPCSAFNRACGFPFTK